MIFLKDVLKQMKEGKKPFHIVFYTANLKQQTGGERKEYKRCYLSSNQPKVKKRKLDPAAAPSVKHRKNPQHDANETINIVIMPQKDVKTVHIRLITEFNHEKVIW